MNIMQRQFGPESQRREPRESLGQYSPCYRKISLGDQEISLGETSPGDQETFLRVFPLGDYFFVTKRNFFVYFLHALVPHPHQERISWSHRENSPGDQEKSLGEIYPSDQETFLGVFPPGDYFLVTKRNFLVYILHAPVPPPPPGEDLLVSP